MKALYECVDPEKLPFLGLTLLPLLGLPLLTRRFERYILLIPYILVNLMSDYRYQHDIFFQYTFGSTGCLVYLALVNLAQLRRPWLRTGAAWLCAAACAVSFCTTVLPRAIPQGVSAVQSAEETRQIRQVLEQIPEDAAVTAGTFYTTALSRREVLYDLRYARREHLLESEYVVVDPTVTGDFKNYGDGRLESLHGLLLGQGYRVEYDNGKDLRIYRKGQ